MLSVVCVCRQEKGGVPPQIWKETIVPEGRVGNVLVMCVCPQGGLPPPSGSWDRDPLFLAQWITG